MKKQVFNPYLPLCEYVPDGEPYVFDGRVYIYGSHDEAGGTMYCPGDYVSWSAPVEDLSDWRFEGVSYRRTQDPSNAEDKLQLWAPDVVKGHDGRYYLYYCFNFHPEIGVAVSDSPAGPFEFYGHVHYADGKVLDEHLPFDPAVFVDDDGKVYLYYGFAPKPMFHPDLPPIMPSPGCMVTELEEDMVTAKAEAKMCAPGVVNADGTTFEGHAFFEAASMRKINGTYYLVYSSQLSHELCYATSAYPDRDFTYGGTIVSNGDVGLNGRTKAVNMTGNNHGGLVEINGQWYIFYHRQTHATESSRQGCAQPVEILPDGSIPQVEITSCGLNGGPLKGAGEYSAGYVCHLTTDAEVGKIIFGQDLKESQPYIFEETKDLHYVANVTDGVTLGWKYFSFEGETALSLVLRGAGEGVLSVYSCEPTENVKPVAEIAVALEDGAAWQTTAPVVCLLEGTLPIYIRYSGSGALSIKTLILNSK